MLCLITEKLCYGPQVSFHYEKKKPGWSKRYFIHPISLFTFSLHPSPSGLTIFKAGIPRKFTAQEDTATSEVRYQLRWEQKGNQAKLLTMPIYHIWAPRFTSWLYPSKCSAHKVLGNGSCAVWRSKWSLWLLVSGWPSSLRSRHWGSKPLHGSSLYLLLKKTILFN